MKNFKKTEITLTDFLVVGDIHGDYESFSMAKNYAIENNLIFVSLGDIMNYGPDGVKIFIELKNMISVGKAHMVAGNHERKIFNYFERSLKGNDPLVYIGKEHQVTIDDFHNHGTSVIESFMTFASNIPNIIEGNFGNKKVLFTHGGVNKLYWKLDKLKEVGNYNKIQKALHNSSLFGDYKDSVNNAPMENYGWTTFIPSNYEVNVGHMPMDKYTTFINATGGICNLIDTGCSKGGYLTGLHYSDNNTKEIKFI
jgi:predicted phosphodiesterase